MNAIIKNNKPYCRLCECELGNMTGEYSLISHEGRNYTKFQRYCDKCRGKYDYYAEITLDKTIRYSFENDIKEIKDGSDTYEIKREN